MKKITIFIISFLMISALYSSGSSSSVAFSNSYLQRASGIEALYWNPANISNIPTRNELMLPIPFLGGSSISLENDVLSLDLYNKVMVEFLEKEVKDEILQSIDKSMKIGVNTKMILAGFSRDRYAFSTSVNVLSKGRVAKEFFEFALEGNVSKYDSGEAINFSDEHNRFGAIAYQDFSIGYGGLRINDFLPTQFDYLPSVYAGFGLSYLVGLYTMEMTHFDGKFFASDETGLVLDQITKIRSAGIVDLQNNSVKIGDIGSGFKMSLGFSVDAVQFDENHYITAGLSLDNIFASIKWSGNPEERYFEVWTDSLYVNNMEEDFFTTTDNFDDPNVIKPFKTEIPFNLKMGALYRFNDLSASLDYSQYFGSNNTFNLDPEISLGAEYVLWQSFPIQIGCRLPIGDWQIANSFGIGYRNKAFEFGIAYQSIGAFYSMKSKGASLASSMKFRF